MSADRSYKTAWQRAKRAELRALAIAAGTYRPPGRPRIPDRAKCHGDRAGQYRRRMERKRRADGELGWTLDHPILVLARRIAHRVVRPDNGAVQYRPLYEDAIGAAALAIVEGSDPHEAARRIVALEREWWARTLCLRLPS